MATVTAAPSMTMTQTCANSGFSEDSQYRPKACEMTETMVKSTRMKQYWKTPTQTTYRIQVSSDFTLTLLSFRCRIREVDVH